MHSKGSGPLIALIVIFSCGIALVLYPIVRPFFDPPGKVVVPSTSASGVTYSTSPRDTGRNAVVDLEVHNTTTSAIPWPSFARWMRSSTSGRLEPPDNELCPGQEPSLKH